MSSIDRLYLHRDAKASARPMRLALAVILHAASRALSRLSARLAECRTVPSSDPLIEFHAEAGAPEGALYVNGELVGWLPGIRRL